MSQPLEQDILPIRSLVGSNVGHATIQGGSLILQRLVTCASVQTCAFYWFVLQMLFGPFRRSLDIVMRQAAWDSMWWNFTARARSLQLRSLRRQLLKRLHLHGHPKGLPLHSAESGAALLVSGHDEVYFHAPNVEPFVRLLKCYARARGMSVIVDHKGARVKQKVLAILPSVPGGRPEDPFMTYNILAKGEDGARNEGALLSLLADFAAGRLEKSIGLAQYERSLGVSMDNPDKYSKAWAIAEHIEQLGPGNLLVYFDVDVTIRPDSIHQGFVDLLLRTGTVDAPAHIYIADTWNGIDCVNTGFVALRNTEISKLFLELWKSKSSWPAIQDQTALAETLLEILGAEASKLSHGKRRYDHQCLTWVFPDADGEYNWANYCYCWQNVLRELVGPYRFRHSRIVSFVDPEHLEMNFVPNNVIQDHFLDLGRMRLLPSPAWPALDPLVIHWAGFPSRVTLMQSYLAKRFNITLRNKGCPQKVPPPRHRHFGSDARVVRCCEQLWRPWTGKYHRMPASQELLVSWGCQDWRPVKPSHCAAVLLGDERNLP